MALFMIPILKNVQIVSFPLSYDTRPIPQHTLSILFTPLESTFTANETYLEFTFDVQCQAIMGRMIGRLFIFDTIFLVVYSHAALEPEACPMKRLGKRGKKHNTRFRRWVRLFFSFLIAFRFLLLHFCKLVSTPGKLCFISSFRFPVFHNDRTAQWVQKFPSR